MNHECYGSYYKISEDEKYYICFLDSTVIRIKKEITVCPQCQRIIGTSLRYNKGKIKTVRQIKHMRTWITLPD
jgi:hypothetical protein